MSQPRTSLDDFQAHLAETLSTSTANTYAAILEHALCDHEQDLVGLLRRPSLSLSSRQTYRAALVKWAEWRQDEVLLVLLRSPELRREMRSYIREQHARSNRRYRVQPFSEAEEAALLTTLGRWREEFEGDVNGPLAWRWPSISMMFLLGLRAGADLARLTRADVELALASGVELSIASKGDQERSLPVVLVVDELRALQRLHGGRWKVLAEVISPATRGKPQVSAAYERLRRTVKKLAEESGLDPERVHPHRFRHSAAHRLYVATGDLVKVQRFLGHRSLDTTMRYLRANRTAEIGFDLLRLKDKGRTA